MTRVPVTRNRKPRYQAARSRSVVIWLKRLVWLAILLGLVIWVFATIWQAKQKITSLPTGSTHAFIATKTTDPTIVLISRSTNPAVLSSLQVFRPDQADRRPLVITLPANLADQDTSAGQYAGSHYDKELQQLVEQTLAVPLTDSLMMPPSAANTPLSVQWLKQQATFWNLTVGLPWTLHALPHLSTSLSATSLWRLAWYLRSLPNQQLKPQTLPEKALNRQAGRVQVATNLSDPLVAGIFAMPSIKDQHTSIVIKNATTTPGLATLVGRFVANMGGDVVAVEVADQQNATQSTLTSNQSSVLTSQLSSFLGIPFHQQSLTGRERADVELVLGSDVLGRLGQ